MMGTAFGLSSLCARRLGWGETGSAIGAAGAWLALSSVINELGYPLAPLSLGLLSFSSVPSLASRVVGVPGLDSLVILCSAGVLQLVRGRWQLLAVTALVWLGASVIAAEWPSDVLGEVAVHVVQPATRTEDFRASGWSLGTRLAVAHRLDSLTAEAGRRRDGLIVWPEGGTGAPDVQVRQRRESIDRALATSDSALVAATTIVGSRGRYNGAALVHNGQVQDITYKSHPVPIAEGDIRRRNAQALDTPFGKVGVLICYDSMFASAIRELGHQGAEYLLLTTDDGSFGHSSALYGHLAITRLHAISYGLPLVVASNMGPSVFFDRSGREIDSSEFAERGVFSSDVQRISTHPPSYNVARWLWLLPLVSLLVAISTRRKTVDAPALGPRIVWVVVAAASAGMILGVAIEVCAQRLRDPAAISDISEKLRVLFVPTEEEFDGFGPAFRQSAQQSCGLAALAAVLSHLGELSTEEELRRACRLPPGLVSLEQLAKCANAAGMVSQGFQGDWQWLTELEPAVAILHVEPEHFVAVLGTTGDTALIFDPERGAVFTVTRKDLESRWTGPALRVGYPGPFL